MNLSEIANMYSSNLLSFGSTSKAVGWNSDETRDLRYSYLNEVLSRREKEKFSLNDFGCGYAGHLENLVGAGFQLTNYYGYEISPLMAQRARETASVLGVEAKILETDKLQTSADFTVVSGTFNVRLDISVRDWRGYVEEKLLEIGRMSRLGFSFNLLSKFVDWEDSNLYYGNPSEFVEFVQKSISPNVILRHDMPLHEWTMIVYK